MVSSRRRRHSRAHRANWASPHSPSSQSSLMPQPLRPAKGWLGLRQRSVLLRNGFLFVGHSRQPTSSAPTAEATGAPTGGSGPTNDVINGSVTGATVTGRAAGAAVSSIHLLFSAL